MQSTNFAEATLHLGAPPNWDNSRHGECGTLPCVLVDGGFASRWMPTDEEMQDLNAGKPVWLYVMGNQHPPVAIEVGDGPL